MLGWDQSKLAEAAGVSIITVKRLEAVGEDIHGPVASAMKTKAALEGAGVLFLDEEGGIGYGVRLRDRRPSRKK